MKHFDLHNLCDESDEWTQTLSNSSLSLDLNQIRYLLSMTERHWIKAFKVTDRT